MTFWDSLTSNELSLDVIRLAAVTANFSKLPAKVISGYSGYMPNASKFLLHFCGNSGTDLYYDADEPIACTAIGRELFNRTMNRLIDEAEDTIADGATVCFATRADRSLYNKNEIKFLEADFYQFRNSMEFDWSYSIGKGTTGIIAEITRNGCEYSMNFKYCIFDLYDWEKDDEGGLYYLNCKGKAMCYKSIGVYEDSFTWISGNRFLTLTDKSSDSVKPLNSIYEYEYLQQWMLSLDHIENFYTWRRYLHPEEL